MFDATATDKDDDQEPRRRAAASTRVAAPATGSAEIHEETLDAIYEIKNNLNLPKIFYISRLVEMNFWAWNSHDSVDVVL